MFAKKDIYFFLFILLLNGAIAINYLIFPDYDWFNYRIYNVWAFLHERMSLDFCVSGYRTCFNPMVDIPDYFLMFFLNKYPLLYVFLSTIDSTIVLFLLYKIINFIFYQSSNIIKNIVLLFSLLYVMFSPVMVLELSFDQNDIKISILILLCLYILIKNLFTENCRKRNSYIFLSGCVLGIAFGLKLTVIVYCISFLFVFLLLKKYIDKPLNVFFNFFLGVFISFLIVDGFWLVKCWIQYHNPVFPYFNNIFHSEYAEAINIIDIDYEHLKPQNIKEVLLFPFLESKRNVRLFGNDNFSWDPRYAINFVITIILIFIGLIYRKFKNNNIFIHCINFNYFFLILSMTIIPYYVNMLIFGTYRYIISSSLFYGFLIALLSIFCISKIKNLKLKTINLISLFLAFLIIAYLPSYMGDIEFVKDYTDKKSFTRIVKLNDLKFEDESYVICLNMGTTVAAVRQNPNAHYIGFMMPTNVFNKNINSIKKDNLFYKADYFITNYQEKYVEKIVNSNSKIYLLYIDIPIVEYTINWLYEIDLSKKRKLKNCDLIDMEVFNSTFWATDIVKCEFN